MKNIYKQTDGSDDSQEEHLGCNLNPHNTEPSSRGVRQAHSTDQERFFWENDYVGKPVNFYHGAAYQVPVIEDETIKIKCKVRAVSEDPYTIIWDFESFNATTTGKTILVNNTDGDEYAQDTITVNISRPAEIDEKDIICSWENGKFSDTITLQFKVYVADDNSHHCVTCEHGVQKKFKRPEIQKKEDINLEAKIIQKVLRTYHDVSHVFIEAHSNYVCGCGWATTTTTTTTHVDNITTNTYSDHRLVLLLVYVYCFIDQTHLEIHSCS